VPCRCCPGPPRPSFHQCPKQALVEMMTPQYAQASCIWIWQWHQSENIEYRMPGFSYQSYQSVLLLGAHDPARSDRSHYLPPPPPHPLARLSLVLNEAMTNIQYPAAPACVTIHTCLLPGGWMSEKRCMTLLDSSNPDFYACLPRQLRPHVCRRCCQLQHASPAAPLPSQDQQQHMPVPGTRLDGRDACLLAKTMKTPSLPGKTGSLGGVGCTGVCYSCSYAGPYLGLISRGRLSYMCSQAIMVCSLSPLESCTGRVFLDADQNFVTVTVCYISGKQRTSVARPRLLPFPGECFARAIASCCCCRFPY